MKMRNFMFKKNYKGDGTLLQGGAYILKLDHNGNKVNRYVRRGPTGRGLQRVVVYLCWPIAPSDTRPNAGELGGCGVSANEYSCAHHVTWSPNKLWRFACIFNLWLEIITLNIPKVIQYTCIQYTLLYVKECLVSTGTFNIYLINSVVLGWAWR